jgi:Mg2+-importing ATPase
MPPGDAPASPLFWSESTTDLLGRLHTEAAGLTSDEAARRLVQVGPNAMTASTHASTLALLARQFSSPITILLAVAAALSLFAGEGTDGGIILGILVVSGLLGFWQEARAADAVARLLARVQTTAAVKRDGVVRDLPRHALVPGDVVLLQAGASVPGDARLLASADLFVDEAALTGESYPAEKGAGDVAADAPLSARTNVVFLGTHVVSGTATAVVVHTGRRTEYGAIAARLAVRGGDTEFERGVRRFGGFLLQVALVLALVVLTINVRLDRPVLDALLFTLALTVGLTPQLLPAIVSVTLAHGARVLAREQVIVRRLGAIEDLGGMDILCTDKTGTITEGVVAMQGAEDWRSAPCDHAFTMAALNAGVASGFANPIDDALRRAAPAATDGWRKLDEVPYDFVRKRLTVAVERHAACDAGRAASPERLLITKGAVRQVLEVCTTVRDAAGADMPIAVARETIEARV